MPRNPLQIQLPADENHRAIDSWDCLTLSPFTCRIGSATYFSLPGSMVALDVNCESPSSPDFDFGEGPALFGIKGSTGMPRDVVGAGQKSGQYWTLDRETGKIVWVTQAGPGGVLGGMIWGSALDGKRVYTANANSSFTPWPPLGVTGFWTAMDAGSGQILWQTANPTGAMSEGPVAVANDVVYGCSLDPAGYMYAMDAATGQISV